MRKPVKKILLHVLLPLIIGFLCYFFFREGAYNYERFFGISQHKNFFLFPRDKPFLPEFFIYNLPDGLWYYSFISFMLILWRSNYSTRTFKIIFISGLSVPFFLELFQFLRPAYGTFDFLDLLCYFTFGLFALYSQSFLKPKFKHPYYEKKFTGTR
jgi:hypothetical protein